MARGVSFLLLVIALGAIVVLAVEDLAETQINVEKQECGVEKFRELKSEMDEKKITDPDLYAPIQELFEKCKVHLMSELERSMDAMPQKKKEFVDALMAAMRSSQDGYKSTVETIARVIKIQAGNDLKKYMNDADEFYALFKIVLDHILESFEGTIFDQVEIYDLVFGEPQNRDQAFEFARRMHERTNQMTLTWIPYAKQLKLILMGEEILIEDAHAYLSHHMQVEKFEKSPFKWFARCLGREPPAKFKLPGEI